MRKFAILMPLVIGLSGCATEPYGNFVSSASSPAGFNESLVADTMKQLVALYPPASTRFDLDQPTSDDPFGRALVESLRAHGYAITELKPTAAKNTNQSAAPSILHYVLDEPVSTNLYRITVLVGPESITRAYLMKNNTIAPAGAWVRREQ